MPAYSNRPRYGESLPMSGDYQAIPRAPRTPHFPEPSVRGQYGYAQTGPFPAQSARSIPNAPGSLSPMAMASVRSAVATGPQQTMDAGPSRPSAKAGMSILLAGAIIGGLIGAVMHARQNAADAIAAASMHEPAPIVAPPSASSASTPPIAPLPLASASGGVIPNFPNDKLADKKDDKKDAADKKDADKAEKKAKTGGGKKLAGGGKKAPGPAETVASAEEPETTTAPAGGGKKKKGAKDDDDGYTIASADGSSGSSPSSGSSSSSSSKADKADKGGDKSDKKESSSKKGGDKETKSTSGDKKSGGSKGGDDAVNVLKAAMGATENTL
jgi:hypothetical protein